MNPHPGPVGGGSKATGNLDQVPQSLIRAQLVDGGAGDLAGNLHQAAMHRDEDDVAVLQPDIGVVHAVEQVIVDVETVHQLLASPHLHPPEAAVGGRPASGVERRQNRPGTGNLVGAGSHYVAYDEDLNVPKSCDGDLELGGGSRPSPDTGIHSLQAGVELVLELAQAEIRDVDLSHLGDDDEALTVDVEGVGLLDISRQDENQHVARA